MLQMHTYSLNKNRHFDVKKKFYLLSTTCRDIHGKVL